jgi:predicted CDP-diglyceride synthetase/phosphatidate cytidylyltransferase
MSDWLDHVPDIDLALALSVVVTGVASLVVGRRGGHYRGLARWGGFWIAAAVALVVMSRAPRWVSFALLASLMFASLRTYFSVAPVRRRDRYAILFSYLLIPFALVPAYVGSSRIFLAAVPVALFLFVPALLSVGPIEKGMLDSMGRTLLGVLFFVFCIAHLGLLTHHPEQGLLELFGILVLASELPQRLTGRFGAEIPSWRKAAGIALSFALAPGLGWLLGPECGLSPEDAAVAGLQVVVAVTLGARVGYALTRDLELSSANLRFGRGASLNYTIPAVYAAPVFYHYLNTFA